MRRFSFAALFFLTSVSAVRAEPVSAAILGVASWYATQGIVVQALVQIGIGLALSAASYGLQYLLSGGGKRVQQGDPIGVQIAERDGLLEARRVYGTRVVAGGVFFEQTVTDSGSSQPDIYVYGAAVSEGECDSLVSVIINGVECTITDASAGAGLPLDAPWNDGNLTYFKVSFRPGTSTQGVDPIIAARFATPPDEFLPDDAARLTKWAQFKQKGVCTVVIEMNFGNSTDHHTELWGAGGIPDIKFKIKGLKVYDPRDYDQDVVDATTRTWSANASLIEADWLIADMGFGIATTLIDWDSVATSAAIDDRYEPTLDGLERRGTINGEVTSTETNVDVLQSMSQQNRALVRKAFGVYTIRAESAAEALATVHQWLLVGDLNYQNEPDTRSAINRVDLQFSPATRFNESAETVYEDAALIAADGQTYAQRVSLRFCDTPSTAQRLGFALVTENRVGRTVTAVLDIAALVAAGKSGQLLEAGDVVNVYLAAPYDAVNGLYKINSIEINGDFTVTIAMSGTSAEIIGGWSTSLETAFEAA
ncbi:MAG: hypothetical protein WC829_02315 [Hyphomicrobium sp.]